MSMHTSWPSTERTTSTLAASKQHGSGEVKPVGLVHLLANTEKADTRSYWMDTSKSMFVYVTESQCCYIDNTLKFIWNDSLALALQVKNNILIHILSFV